MTSPKAATFRKIQKTPPLPIEAGFKTFARIILSRAALGLVVLAIATLLSSFIALLIKDPRLGATLLGLIALVGGLLGATRARKWLGKAGWTRVDAGDLTLETFYKFMVSLSDASVASHVSRDDLFIWIKEGLIRAEIGGRGPDEPDVYLPVPEVAFAAVLGEIVRSSGNPKIAWSASEALRPRWSDVAAGHSLVLGLRDRIVVGHSESEVFLKLPSGEEPLVLLDIRRFSDAVARRLLHMARERERLLANEQGETLSHEEDVTDS